MSGKPEHEFIKYTRFWMMQCPYLVHITKEALNAAIQWQTEPSYQLIYWHHTSWGMFYGWIDKIPWHLGFLWPSWVAPPDPRLGSPLCFEPALFFSSPGLEELFTFFMVTPNLSTYGDSLHLCPFTCLPWGLVELCDLFNPFKSIVGHSVTQIS